MHFSNFAFDWEIRGQLRISKVLGEEWHCCRPSRALFARFSCLWTQRHFRKQRRWAETSFEGGWGLEYPCWVTQNPKAATHVNIVPFGSLKLDFGLQTHDKVVTEQLLFVWEYFSVQKYENRANSAREGQQHSHTSPRTLLILNWPLISQSTIFECKVREMHS